MMTCNYELHKWAHNLSWTQVFWAKCKNALAMPKSYCSVNTGSTDNSLYNYQIVMDLLYWYALSEPLHHWFLIHAFPQLSVLSEQ